MSDVARGGAVQAYEDIINGFGEVGAEQICFTLIDSLQTGMEAEYFLRPIAGFKLMVRNIPENQSVYATAESKYSQTISFCFNSAFPVQQILKRIPSAVTHELAHTAHAQHMPDYYDNKDTILWDAVVREGLAMHAASVVHDPNFDPDNGRDYNKAMRKRIKRELVKVLFDPGTRQKARHKEFMYGDDNFPNRGYWIGEYVVKSFAVESGYSVLGLMQTPYREFRDFAESLVCLSV